MGRNLLAGTILVTHRAKRFLGNSKAKVGSLQSTVWSQELLNTHSKRISLQMRV
jgi:hypothetical protein